MTIMIVSIRLSLFHRLSRACIILLVLLVSFPSLETHAQFPVGHRTLTFFDTARNNRQIPAEIYYPAVTAGNNTTVASGVFPVIVFGHGYLMPYSAYAYFQNAMVPEGYFVVFPTTEGTFLPNHLNFGLDLAFLVNAMKNEGSDPSSPFYQHVDSTSAIMGHSMGGGASFLACDNNTTPTVMVTFAAAETSPSAIAAASGVTIPTLVFAASEDCVAPPATNQVPMYDSLAGDCKVYISITGGGHCYFADYNFQCSLGEAGCQQNFTISREEQHEIVLDFTKPYLDYFLKKNTESWILFNDSLASSQRITYMKSCTITGSEILPRQQEFHIFPNPAGDIITIYCNLPQDADATVLVSDLSGRISLTSQMNGINFPCSINISALPSGFWIISVVTGKTVCNMKLIRN
jgi:predicted dienelactone hydrolase